MSVVDDSLPSAKRIVRSVSGAVREMLEDENMCKVPLDAAKFEELLLKALGFADRSLKGIFGALLGGRPRLGRRDLTGDEIDQFKRTMKRIRENMDTLVKDARFTTLCTDDDRQSDDMHNLIMDCLTGATRTFKAPELQESVASECLIELGNVRNPPPPSRGGRRTARSTRGRRRTTRSSRGGRRTARSTRGRRRTSRGRGRQTRRR